MSGSGTAGDTSGEIHRVITMSARSATWSLCTWVTNWAVNADGRTPASVSRRTVPRPASNWRATSPNCTRAPAPARPGDGNGTPVPVSVTTVGSSIDRRDGREPLERRRADHLPELLRGVRDGERLGRNGLAERGADRSPAVARC